MKTLLLTLGHNSSAIGVVDNKIEWGYETERVTGIKSDSQFPQPVLDYVGDFKPDIVYVTHWAPDGNLSSMGRKYWHPEVFDGIPIRTLSADRTHHDTHMAAAMCYAGPRFPYGNRTYGLVIDGFGTFGEHFSIYKLNHQGSKTLIRRYHGYGTSLGLWYQYATAFMGMKMHEDEYKLLGYEVHCPRDVAIKLDSLAYAEADNFLLQMATSVYGSKFDPLYNLDALPEIKSSIFSRLTRVCEAVQLDAPDSDEGRIALAFYVQKVLENVVLRILDALNAQNVILSGGVFYNVKLNHLISKAVDGFTCVYPLAGDQGNAIGLYSMDHPDFVFPDNLNWGKRVLKDVGVVTGLTVCDQYKALDIVREKLETVGYVNLVRGNMEFGPRAMCHTSTLAMPSLNTVDNINYANNRNTVMPMAPVMTLPMAHQFFERTQHVWRSMSHMVIAMEFKEYPLEPLLGIAHEYHLPYHHHTGRPQVIDHDDDFMLNLLARLGHPLINTSFNYHGQPIALGMEAVIRNHLLQRMRDPLYSTVVIQNA